MTRIRPALVVGAVLTCYETTGEMHAAAAERARAGTSPGVGQATAVTTGYIVVFVDGGYGGASQALSQDYPYLGSIGWNDRISSFKSYGATGHFWEHSPTGGFIYWFGSTSQVSYVGDTYNDKFSALYLS